MWSVGQPPGGPNLKWTEWDEFVEMRHRVVLRLALRATRGIPFQSARGRIRRCSLLTLKSPPRPSPDATQATAWQRLVGSAAREIFFRAPLSCCHLRVGGAGAGPRRTCGGATAAGGGDVGGWCGLQSAVGSDSRSRRGRRPRESGCPVVTSSERTEARSRFDLAGHGNCGRMPCPTRTPGYLSGNDPAGDRPGGAASARCSCCSCCSGIPPVVPSLACPLWDVSPSFRPFRPALFRPFWDCPSCL